MRYFTKVFKDALQADANAIDNVNLRLVLFRTAPDGEINYDYGLIPTAAKLILGNYPGWELISDQGYPFATSITVNPATVATSEYVFFTEFNLLELKAKVGVMAMGVEVVGTKWGETNPLIMVTTEPFDGRDMLTPDDVITAHQDPKAGNQRWLLAWTLTADGPARVASLTMGDIAVSIGPPDFQESHHFDAWLYPQRVNYIANPSFEAISNVYWATNGTFSRVTSDVGGFAGQFALTPSFVRLNGTAGTYIEGPDIAAMGGAKKVEIEISCSADNWAANVMILGQGQATLLSYSWYVMTVSGPRIYFAGSPNGTSTFQYGPDPHSFVAGSRHTIGGTWTGDTGTLSTWQPKHDGANFGPPISVAQRFTTGLFNSPQTVQIGRYADDTLRMTGNIYSVKIWADDKLVASPDFTSMTAGQTSVTDAQGNVWTLKGAASIGNLPSAPLVVESNVFPTDQNDGIWTTQLLIKGTGLLSVGFVFWSERYDATYVDWGRELWQLTPNAMLPIKVMRRCSEAVEGMLRLQVEGGISVTIDKVLVEPGPLTDWPYFDGDEDYGAPDDFTWYGTRGESYSLWYNNRRSIISRIFTKPVHTGTVYTDSDAHGLAYNWVPAGTVVDYHLDVLRPDDLKKPPIVKNGVMPSSTADPVFGVPVPATDKVLTVQYEAVLDSKDAEEVFIAGGS